MDKLVSELSEKPNEKKRKVTFDPRLRDKHIAKELILDFLYADENRRRRGFKVSTMYKEVNLGRSYLRTQPAEVYG